MGCSSSVPQNNGNNTAAVDTASTKTAKRPLTDKICFTDAEIAQLKERFKKMSALDKDDGLIDKKEFMEILKFDDSLFVDRMFKMFDSDGSGSITSDEFISGLSVLHENGKWEDKVALSFRMWDLNNDQLIQESELAKLMKSSLDNSSLLISPEQVAKLISSTFKLTDTDDSGAITLQEYHVLVKRYPTMIANMTLSFKLI